MSYHKEIEDMGFTVVRGFLSKEEVDKYLKASREVVQYARDGNWKDVRTRGKQFPPWPKNFSPDIWGVSGLLHPDLKEKSITFQEIYSKDALLAIAADILQAKNEDLSMELFNMLINPLTDFGLDWHRDSIRPDVTPQQEAEQLLEHPYAGTQFNLALTEDSCLIVIPGSHKRLRTDEERAKTTDDSRKGHITGQISVHLYPGDVVFYNNNILHRAQYSAKQERLILHGSYGHKTKGHVRAKGILQHGVAKWLDEFTPINDNMQSLKDGLVAMVNEFGDKDLGFALDG